ncbi:MAG: heme lyase CcmF/NrfE family subunit [Anaerolineae bacterium]|nr:heme lyase CcmF/NrfE family subunit [Anaerolineae bacterium]
MLGEIGTILIALSFVVTLYGACAAFRGIARRDSRWARSAQHAVYAAPLLLGTALLALLSAFLSDDFQIEYVAAHSSSVIPFYLKISAVWAGQEGSLLLWCFLQALFTALATGCPTEKARPLVPWATVFLNLITAFFVAVTLFLSNPFTLSAMIPAGGWGLNPLLRHPGMIFHPPALYVGYVSLSIPFSFALAALVTRQIQDWTRALRTWILVAWLGLGLGLILGMRWAYDVLGWGGYWGWDPVENAGLLPWLTATALLHGAVMQDEKRGFYTWNILLALFSFVLVLFGTFATRSGMIQSVHAYTASGLGGYFLTAILVTLTGSLGLLIARREVLKTSVTVENLFSRDGMFFLTLLLLSLLAVSIFTGSVLPTFTGMLTLPRFEAGPAWFDRVTGPQFAALVLIMGLCPLLGRAAATLRRLKSHVWILVTGGSIVPVVAALLGFTRPISLIGFAVVGLAGFTTLAAYGEGVIARCRHTRESPFNALWGLLRAQRRKYGGYLVHMGVILMALGVTGTRMYPFEQEMVLAVGDPVTVGDYTLTFMGLAGDFIDDYMSIAATVTVYRDDTYLATLEPRLNNFMGSGQSITVPALRSGIREDLYLILSGWTENGNTVTLKVVVNALVNFLWLGGLIFLTGGALALWPAGIKETEFTFMYVAHPFCNDHAESESFIESGDQNMHDQS